MLTKLAALCWLTAVRDPPAKIVCPKNHSGLTCSSILVSSRQMLKLSGFLRELTEVMLMTP